MYTIRLDGELLYSPAMRTESYTALAPKLSLDVNGNGACSFVLPPGNRLYHAIRRRKGVVTVYQDGAEIFRGRVMDDETDTYKQKGVYAEGVRAFLNDSLAAPYAYDGTAQGLLQKLIAEHNDQVEEDKRFAMGRVTCARAGDTISGLSNTGYWPTYQEIDDKILSVYGGYLKPRYECGVLYLDWLEEYGGECAQQIRFGVNLLDLRDKNDAGDMFTILRPLGASDIGENGEYSAPVSIASVNNGLDYIQDDDAVQKYGRIWKAYTWGHITDPAELLKKAQEYLKTGAELRTLSIQAIDMHLMDGSTQAIRIGDKVKIHVQPHGMEIEMPCSKMDIDLENPENTLYTFGEAPRMLTDNVIMAEEEIGEMTGGFGGGGGRSVKQENNGIIRWAEIRVNEQQANINMLAYEANQINNRLSMCEVDIDGINANIWLMASRDEVDELGKRVSQAEIEIDGANAEINLRASKTEVDDLGKRVSSAEIRIDGAESAIELKADKTYVDNLIAERIEAVKSDIAYSISENIVTDYAIVYDNLSVYGTIEGAAVNATGSFSFKGDAVQKTAITVITGISGGGVSGTDTTLLTTGVGGARTIEAGSADAVYSNGMQARFIQGEEYTSPLYEPGESVTIRKQGDLFTGALYYDGGSEEVTLQGGLVTGGSLYEDGGEETVTVQGSAYTTPLYVQSGGTYHRISGTLYNAGSSRTFYKRGPGHAGPLYGAGSKRTFYKRGEEYTSPLYEPGSSETIKKQGDLLEAALYRQGKEYSGGLYTNFSPAQITLQDITALTA